MDLTTISFLDIKQFLMFNEINVPDDKDIAYTVASDLIESGNYTYIPENILKYIEQQCSVNENVNFNVKESKYLSMKDIEFDEIELFLSANDMTIPNDLDLAYKLTATMIKKKQFSFIQDSLLAWQNMLVLGEYDENSKDIVNINYLTNLRDELLYLIFDYLDPRSIILFCETGKCALKQCRKLSFRKLLTDKIGNCDKLSNNQLFFYAKSYVLRRYIFESYSDGLSITKDDYIYGLLNNNWILIQNDHNIKQYFLSLHNLSRLTLLTNKGDILEKNKFDNKLSKRTDIYNICNLYNFYNNSDERHCYAVDYN